MHPQAGSDRPHRLAALSVAAIASVYLLLRVTFLLAREPFFDELYTRWISALSFSQIIDALRHDSGPPLYYFLVHALMPHGPASVYLARAIALLCSVGALLAILYTPLSREARVLGALLLALYPAHLYFSTEARAYALCGSLVGVACVLLARWSEGARRRELVLATLAIIAAAYTHYYGALFIPIPLLFVYRGRPRPPLDSPKLVDAAAAATICAGLAFIPGLLLALHQPREAMRWMTAQSALDVANSSVRELSMAANYPSSFAPPAPLVLQVIAVALLLAALARGVFVSARARLWFSIVVWYVGAAIVLTLAGVSMYFPMRFESVIAVPLILALTDSLMTLSMNARRLLAGAMILISLLGWARALSAFRGGASDPYRDVAQAAREAVPAQSVIVASGPAYLEIESQRVPRWAPRIVAFPSEQATHPGWRAVAAPAVLASESSRLAQRYERFFWIGDAGTPEVAALNQHFALRPMYRSGSTVIVIALRRAFTSGARSSSRVPPGSR